MKKNQSRRAFLARSAALGVVGAASPFVLNLAAIGEAAAATATDYKALVCLFMYGGNDYANTLVPYDQNSYDLYNGFRKSIALPRADLAATVLNPTLALPQGRQYALAPGLAPVWPVFNSGKMAAVLNVGTLVQPTTKAQYLANSVKLPPKLFSHNDQQSFWQACNPEGATSGWGGRMGDLLQSGNGNMTLTCINPSGNAVFMTGKSAVQYAISIRGPIALNTASGLFGSSANGDILRSIMTNSSSDVLQNEYSRITRRSLDSYGQVAAALQTAPITKTPWPAKNMIADQLSIVAKMISVSGDLGAKRQIFFVSMGQFDTHDGIPTKHPVLMDTVGKALKAFYDTTVELGISDKVTTFTASDFGRTLTANTDGSDHGWGSMHFVLGGAVNGNQLYGTPPVVADNGPDDVGHGRLLPSISVDQYAFTMAKWFGVLDTDMKIVLPNIDNYVLPGQYAGWNLGFV